MSTTSEETSGAELFYKVRRARRRRDARQFAFVALAVVGLLMVPRLTLPALLRTTEGEPGWKVFRESKKGWMLTYPASWHAQRIAEVSRGWMYHPSAYGIFLSNVERELTHPTGEMAFSRFDPTGLPDSFVALKIQWSYVGGFTPTCAQWGTPLPLSLKDAKNEPLPQGSNGPPHQQLSMSFTARYEPLYSVTAWIGSGASAADRAIVERIVSSISFDDAPKTFSPEAPITECGF